MGTCHFSPVYLSTCLRGCSGVLPPLFSLSHSLPDSNSNMLYLLEWVLSALSLSLEASWSGQRAVPFVWHALSLSPVLTGWCMSCPWQPCAGDVLHLECWKSGVRKGMTTCPAQSVVHSWKSFSVITWRHISPFPCSLTDVIKLGWVKQ